MKKILYISYHFPPNNGSTSVMNFQVVNNLAESFKICLVTPRPNPLDKGNNLLDRLNENVKIHYTEIGILHRRFYKNVLNNGAKPRMNNHKVPSGKNKIRKLVNNIALKLKDKVLIPDPVIDWYPEVMMNIDNIINGYKPDMIISSATPYTSHIIGYKISRKYNIPLILYYGDPWVYEQSRKRGLLRFNIEKKLENRILNHANKIFVVTETTKELYEENYNISPTKISVTRSGFDPIDYNYKQKCGNNKLNMIYGGALNPIHRNPMPFLNALNTLDEKIKNDFHFSLYTDEPQKYSELVKDMGLNNVIDVRNLVPYEKFINLLEDSDLLILFGNSSSLQVPGKVYDYIGSLTKILLINNTKNFKEDPTYKILSSYKENFYCTNEFEDIQLMLKNLHTKWSEEGLGKNMFEDVEKFTWRESLSDLKNYLEDFNAK